MNAASIPSDLFRHGALRLDAPYYINDAIKYQLLLSNCPYKITTIGHETFKIFSGNIFTRTYVENQEYGVPYLTASNMQSTNLKTDKFIAKQQAKKLDYLLLHKNWILISCSGTLGKCVYTDDRFEGKIGTHDLIRCIPQKRNIREGVIYAFLAGKFGYAALTHSKYGSVVQHINPEHVRNISVPIFPEELQTRVDALIKESVRLQEESYRAQEEAIRLVEEEIEKWQK